MSDASDLVLAFGTLIANLGQAYNKSKEIDFRREELMANYRLKKRDLENEEKALDYQHKENMEKINVAERCYFEMLEENKNEIRNNHLLRDALMEDARKFRDIILDPQASPETLERMSSFYNKAWENIIALTRETHAFVLENTGINNVLLSNNKSKQIKG